jgi:hypothetical protein
MGIVIYHHDPVEVDPKTSWTGLCPSLAGASYVDITKCREKQIVECFAYARPDAVISVDGKVVVSIEQTQMNPSGHNIPQRFSCLVRAAELGIPSILYYPAYSRRTFSDPNVRYLQVRVPLAQKRMSQIYGVPSLSVFWPTNSKTKLPATDQPAHRPMATVIESLVVNAVNHGNLLKLVEVRAALQTMDEMIKRFAARYKQNSSVRKLLRDGFPGASANGLTVDPPSGVVLYQTADFVRSLPKMMSTDQGRAVASRLNRRNLTLVYTGTANKMGNDSEHPWPGYLTLFDMLYVRTDTGRKATERLHNLVYRLPVPVQTFVARANQSNPPTATYIVDSFADLVILNGGAVPGRPGRGDAVAYSIPC